MKNRKLFLTEEVIKAQHKFLDDNQEEFYKNYADFSKKEEEAIDLFCDFMRGELELYKLFLKGK